MNDEYLFIKHQTKAPQPKTGIGKNDVDILLVWKWQRNSENHDEGD